MKVKRIKRIVRRERLRIEKQYFEWIKTLGFFQRLKIAFLIIFR